MRAEIRKIISSVRPFDLEEREHVSFVQNWIDSGTEIFRIAKPNIPDTHLVAYFLLVDTAGNKVLLVDHKKADLWLPAGGHVELNEHPKETVKREIREELNVDAEFLSDDPFLVTVTKTVGNEKNHTDVSLWYLLKGSASDALKYDEGEFHQIRWFSPADIPYNRADPHLSRCIKKMAFSKILSG